MKSLGQGLAHSKGHRYTNIVGVGSLAHKPIRGWCQLGEPAHGIQPDTALAFELSLPKFTQHTKGRA